MKRILHLIVLVAVLLLLPWPVYAQETISLDIPEITGLVGDPKHKVYWATTEAGGKVSSLSKSGQQLTEISYEAKTKSVTALSLANKSLYIGDLGGMREKVQILKLATLDADESKVISWQLSYPDGEHDSKAFAVSPKGNIYLITTGNNPAIYRATGDAGDDTELSRVTKAPAGVTDAVFLSDGKHLALRTVDQVLIINAYEWETTASSYIVPQEGGEAMALSLDKEQLLLSNTNDAVIIDIPKKIDNNRPEAPEPSAEPTQEPTQTTKPAEPSTSPAAQNPDNGNAAPPVATSTDADSVSRLGTFTAIGAAILISVGAAAVVFVRR
ncbi:MAG: hypothetical protein CR979_01705 [Propionibacterium sp.]|nr:MAG: hypothetical protein CR979_01705 [Propionibacterium sp.]